MTRLNNLVEAWVAAGRKALRAEELAEIVRAAKQVVTECARRYRLSDADADDVAQEVSARFVADLRDGRVVPERPEALVRRMSENRAKDLWRATRRGRTAAEKLTAEANTMPAGQDPEGLWLDREHQVWAQRTVRELLEQAPDNYKTVLRRHYFDDVSIEDIVEEDFRRLIEEHGAGLDDAEEHALRKKARNRVDQHVKRGKDWLRLRLNERRKEEEP